MKAVLRSTFIYGMRILRRLAAAIGLLGFLERRRANRWCLWLRSLFAIYDFKDLCRVDLPWWTLESTDIIERFLKGRGSVRIFEYGSGASTVWLTNRAAEVISVEHDADWAAEVQDALLAIGARARVHCVPAQTASPNTDPRHRSARDGYEGLDFGAYVNSINDHEGRFDLIIIDGRCRAACLTPAIEKIRPDGLLLFDNSARQRYRQAIEGCGLTRLDTRGLTACLPYPDQTTLLSPSSEVIAGLRP